MPAVRFITRDHTRLAVRDSGGADGQNALLRHGLAGHAGEWAQTASWPTARCRVAAWPVPFATLEAVEEFVRAAAGSAPSPSAARSWSARRRRWGA